MSLASPVTIEIIRLTNGTFRTRTMRKLSKVANKKCTTLGVLPQGWKIAWVSASFCSNRVYVYIRRELKNNL